MDRSSKKYMTLIKRITIGFGQLFSLCTELHCYIVSKSNKQTRMYQEHNIVPTNKTANKDIVTTNGSKLSSEKVHAYFVSSR